MKKDVQGMIDDVLDALDPTWATQRS